MNIELKEEIEISNFYLSNHEKLSCLKDGRPVIYFWVIKDKKGQEHPIYIGETKKLYSRFFTHIQNIIVGNYWTVDKIYAEDFFEVFRKMQSIDKGWENILEELGDVVEANYGENKIKKMIDLNLIERRRKYLDRVKIRVFTFADIEDQALRKEVEGKLILDFSAKLANQFACNGSLLLKHSKSNHTAIGAVSRKPRPGLVISNINKIFT